jgi:hypothetical protein
MANRKPLTDENGEVRELTQEDFVRMVPFSALPKEMQEVLSSPKHVVPDAASEPASQPAA